MGIAQKMDLVCNINIQIIIKNNIEKQWGVVIIHAVCLILSKF